ncbi:MAG: amino acid ABC transporter permease [Actinomycetota bacterium]|nr:amino acid ABC transporter permease [Actinomycetota bacterium]
MLGGLAALIVTSPGWTSVRKSFFSWYWFRKSFPDVLSAFWLDVKMFLILEAIVLVFALMVALCRNSRAPALFPLKLVATVYTDLFRGIPTLLLIALFGFGIPGLNLPGVPTDPVILGCAALALSYSAYVAEVYRAGIDSVHGTQIAAALAIGLTRAQAMRHVVLPQAVRRVLPPLLNDFISLQKDVVLVSLLGVIEAFRQAQIIESYNFNSTPLVAAALLYVCITIPLARILDHMQARARRRREAALA